MISSPRRAAPRAAVLLASVLLLAGCGGLSASGPHASAGSLAEQVDLSGQTYVVGSKNFDEQQVLCQISIAALESVGAAVTDRCNVGRSDVTRQALVHGDISTYWEYTGTAWASFLTETRKLPDDEVLRELRERDRAENGVVWLDRAGFDNTYAFVVDGTTAARLHLDSISDMAAYLRSGQPGSVCVETEYNSRADGLRGLQQAYDMEIPRDRTEVVEQGLIFQSTADGVCLFGEVAATDGRIPGLGLKVLDDDRGYHITYSAVPTIRQDVFDRAPQVADVFAPIAAALDQPTIQRLNGRVSAGGESPRDVARAWLTQRGFIGG
ncbi:L-proline glycine betaine binding ABC transporter protein ProX / Osmotic adaptation [Pseudonocardia sp. Ae168_Ps1]|uniref:glycine betaine ABC transporter substrate-binding protein n=1 Tax=unclassified Pseudonocardia TaxID=2619320 RepID=UPI0009692068|nr:MULTISPECIES: glycine betaine ABC transporter substrate-binding protein [unclassified Pseudonocardia]OLL71115.1 L-proline glycine betaine binding ABC transporter protein ProX / Osmotic adaptation [Pseudonocardia sp. Ae168_Ps1]OLL77334.1 L-proline glycine betaine binding ABC transporter protein ProX / Osmotic adaptation [Pseudonocardia sp. Ae150A_Ps1]OLL88555.1 L-proline glycine betaine binding ABC transporter protein ProX / Osmotic adaptation [Pseudonocardia sp. Ae263_Ps1]OLL91423.1 L-prolin